MKHLFKINPKRFSFIAKSVLMVCFSVGALAQNKAPVAAVLAPGMTQAMKDTKLGMSVAGRVDGVMVREGQRVRPGQVLLYLDRQAEALEVQRRKLLLQDTARLQELRGKETVLKTQIESLRPLVASGAVSRKVLEDEEMALGTVVAERKALEIAKQREQVELNLAEDAYERRHLRSPIQGVVTKVLPKTGESIGAHEPLVHVVDVSRVRFVGNVPAAQGSRLREGAKVTIHFGASEQAQNRVAKVVFVSPVTDPASGLIEVIAEFDNADGSIRPGVMGRLAF